ncbi:helix-turn-helix domain-containing protein [Burkholderia pyrrocinia]|uniref:helix-turn-helix domain-containing protein n=1 Tax=Burkholderia pyrrocinia TaxID=60550 RepID=UPI002AAF4B9B|nr:helix-turn-helix domain-containing protein [Burkholderia pyrrocinia]
MEPSADPAWLRFGGDLLVSSSRLARSLRYLQAGSPRLSIGEIADMCGFSDQSAFGKQFRQRFAFTPSEARHASASDAVAA